MQLYQRGAAGLCDICQGCPAFLIAIPTVYFAHPGYFAHDLVPPVDRVYIATIQGRRHRGCRRSAADLGDSRRRPAIARRAAAPARHIVRDRAADPNPVAGWAVLVGIAIRVAMLKWKRAEASGSMEVLAAGFIGGDALYGFLDSVIKTTLPKVK